MPVRPFDSIPTRHSLLRRLKDCGDQTSWQEFFDSYSELIYNVAVKAGLSDVEAQDVVQETIIAVARKIGEFKADPAHGSFSAWLMQLTRWRIVDRWRTRQVEFARNAASSARKTSSSNDDTNSTGTLERIPDPAGVALEGIWAEEWQKHLIAAALEQVKQQVSARQFQMFDLHAMQNLSAQKTAATLQTSVASVYMAKHRISRLLKRELKRLAKQPLA